MMSTVLAWRRRLWKSWTATPLRTALMLVGFLLVGLLSPLLIDKAVSAEPHRPRCVLEDPERPCNWDYPPMHTHFVNRDPHWFHLAPGYRFPKGNFFDVMHKAYYDATHGTMDHATRTAKARIKAEVAAHRADGKINGECHSMFTCWWSDTRHNVACIGSVVTQYGCTRAAPDTPADDVTDEYMRKITGGAIGCGLASAVVVEEAGPAVIGPFSVCMVGAWVNAFFGIG